MRTCEGASCTECYYHRKLAAGLLGIGLNDNERRMAELDQGLRDYVRRYPDPVVSGRGRHHVLESGVLDDEQREISTTLHVLGADDGAIRSALSRRKRPRTLLLNKVRQKR